MNEWLTVAQIEKETNIPDATIRRYIRNHGHHFKVKKKGKSYLMASDTVELMRKVREWYAEGMQIEQVEDKLKQSGIPMTITVIDEEKEVTVNMAEALQDIRKSMNEMNRKHDELMNAFQLQQQYIDQKLEARDQKLIEALKESMEVRKQLAITEQKEPEKKNGFFSRFFKKKNQ